MEVWKTIKGFENYYEVSSLGRVRGVDRVVNHKTSFFLNLKSKLIKPYLNKNGYLFVNITKKSKSFNKSVHRLVCETFLENQHNKKDVNHIDGNKLNNEIKNLEWCTRSENLIHAYNIGLKDRGEKHYNAKLTENQVLEIRSLNNISKTEIGIKYKVSRKCISKILNRQTWKHV
jgi:hypothetical protein